jgi:hypothetical protein
MSASRLAPALIACALALPALAQTTTTPTTTDRRAAVRESVDTNHDGKISQEERDAARARYDARFKAADTNHDGGLSRDELKKAGGFAAIERNFDAMDTNKDGKVTLDERHAYAKARRDARKTSQAPAVKP